MSLHHLHTLLPFSCSDNILSLSCLRVGSTHDCEFCNIPSFLWMRLPLGAFTPAAAACCCCCCCSSSSSLTWLGVSWSAGTPRLRHVRKDLPVNMSGGAFSLSFSLVLHARLARFHRLPFTTASRVLPFCLHSLLWRCFAFCTGLHDSSVD